VLEKAQLPVGWEHAPWNSAEWAKKSLETPDWYAPWKLSEYVKWFLSVLLSGFLVGLGGPFWFDTYRKLAALSGIAKNFQGEVKKEGQTGGGGNTSADQAGGKKSDRLTDIFTISRKASNFTRTRGRRPLTTDGSAIPTGHLR